MKRLPPQRFAAILALGSVLIPAGPGFGFRMQEEVSPAAVLLSRARTLEQRGRLDLAKQDWAQVLVVEPNDAEALAGLVRAARAESRTAEAGTYLAKLKAAHPKAPELAQLEAGNKARIAEDQADATRLLRAGDARGAMVIYRHLYGLNPPAGGAALAYYEAEAATEEGRPHAIAGLRALADRYPADARYPVALGRVLLGSPRTLSEGRTILERYPKSPDAVAALRSALPLVAGAGTTETLAKPPETAVASNRGATPDGLSHEASSSAAGRPPERARVNQPIREATDAGVQHAQGNTARHSASRAAESMGPRLTPVSGSLASGSATRHGAYAAEEQAGYAALNAHRAEEAEQQFQGILAKDPTNPRALAGMGYLRVTTGDLKTATNYFERAQENGDRSLALTRALVNALFELALQEAAAGRAKGDLPGAEARYRGALKERPSDPGALDGLGETLLGAGRLTEAIAVFTRLTEVRPSNPAAWRGLVLAQAGVGNTAGVLATDARVPSEAKGPLLQDPGYAGAIAKARSAPGTQVARVEAPPPTAPPPAPAAVPPPAPVAVPPRAPAAAPPLAPVVPPPTPVPALPLVSATVPPRVESRGVEQKPRPGTRSVAKRPLTGKDSKAAKAVVPASPAAVATATPVAPPVASAPSAPSVSEAAMAKERTEQGSASLLHGENGRAATLFREALATDPNRAEAWRGLVLALHAAGRDADAAEALQSVPASAQPALERDATFETAAGAVFLTAERPNEALHAFARAQTVFASQKLPPPLDLTLHTARLLLAREDDANLYRELVYLGARADLADAQRQQVQMIWTAWAVRHARRLAAAGEQRRAVTVLNAAAGAFAGNGKVLNAVAEGYAGVGLPREAVALFKAQDLTSGSAADIETAIGAAVAARDFRAAEGWAKLGRTRFPSDPEMLTAAAELEQARGHQGRAVELSQQAKALAPAQNPGQVLTAELREADAGHGWHEPRTGQLAVLLAPAEAQTLATGAAASHPFLPAPPSEAPGSTGTIAETPVLTGYDEPSR